MLDSESFVRDISQRTVKEDDVVKSLATQGKSHVNKWTNRWTTGELLQIWCVTSNLVKTVTKPFNPVKDVTNASKKEPHVNEETSLPHHSRSRSHDDDSHRHESHRPMCYENSDTSSLYSLHLSLPDLHREEPLSRQSNSLSHSRYAHHSSCRSSPHCLSLKPVAQEHLPKGFKAVNTRPTDFLHFKYFLLINIYQRYNHYVAKHIAKTARLM